MSEIGIASEARRKVGTARRFLSIPRIDDQSDDFI
jgi:hypothetical protein